MLVPGPFIVPFERAVQRRSRIVARPLYGPLWMQYMLWITVAQCFKFRLDRQWAFSW
jgi:hypothetical protein